MSIVSRRGLTYSICGLCGLISAGIVFGKYNADIETAQQEYVTESTSRTHEIARDVNDTFITIYEGLRTMARLPGVRKIDRYAQNFDTDARLTVQEIYNNLAVRVAMSEVYIIPLDLEPDRIDPHTNKLQEPIITFDELIIGKHADKKEKALEDAQEVPEIEIYEYRLMKQQLAWLRKHYPSENTIRGLQFPAICGPEVITCDNRYFSPLRPNDKDRSGLVYSVPFYGPDGKLKGCISAVILTHSLQNLLPSGDYAIRHREYDYTVVPTHSGQWQASEIWIKQGKVDPGLRYSLAQPLNIVDSQGKWTLWAGQPDTHFWQRTEVKRARQFALMGYIVSFTLMVVLALITKLLRRQQQILADENLKLEKLVTERTLSLHQSQEELRRQNENLEGTVAERTQELVHQAFHDPLTGLPNRAHVLYHLKQLAEKQHTAGKAILFLDLDNFKFINDSLGHAAGDELLITVAERIKQCTRPEDTVARLGGDEFIIILDNISTVETAVQIATKVLEVMSVGVSLSAGTGMTSVSIGIAYTDAAIFAPDTLIRDADTAMYQAKLTGKAAYALYEPSMNDRITERVEIEVGLRIALEQQQFCIHYQPLIDLKTGRLSGVEALVRWQHPERGLIPPGKFIPIAEESGLIVPIGYWVLEEACRQLLLWKATYSEYAPATISVNLSGKQLQKSDVVVRVKEILEKTGLPAEELKLEITESVMMEDMEKTVEKLNQLRTLGIKLALDDFGTGYSSMASLSAFPLDTIKIDKAFVNRLGGQNGGEAIIAAIIQLSKSLMLNVTGEGVETADQLSRLQGLGCDIGQGYFFSKPLDATQLEGMMRENPGSFVTQTTTIGKAQIERLLMQVCEPLLEEFPEAA